VPGRFCVALEITAICFMSLAACVQGQVLPEIHWQSGFGGSTNDIIRTVTQTSCHLPRSLLPRQARVSDCW
jgi:hypothetical protein